MKLVLTDVMTGEQGVVDLRRAVWEQDEVWRTKEGEVLRIVEMEPSHAANTVKFLHRRAKALHQRAFRRLAAWGDGPLAPRGDIATFDYENELNALAWADPHEWLDSTPLVRALRERAA